MTRRLADPHSIDFLLHALRGNAPPPPAERTQGVMMTMTSPPKLDTNRPLRNGHASASGELVEPEGVIAARSLRHLFGQVPPDKAFPMALAADTAMQAQVRERGWRALWDMHVELDVAAALRVLEERAIETKHVDGIWNLWKFVALALSPFSETLYLDSDVLVLSENFVPDLLGRTLRLSDLAFPQDPARPPTLHRKNHQSKLLQSLPYSKAQRVFPVPLMYGRGVPPVCGCIIAYRQTRAVRAFFQRVTARLLNYSNPFDTSAGVPLRVRQTDQEMIWFELATGVPDPMLRLFVLPEEYLCPAWVPTYHRGYPESGPGGFVAFVKAIAQGKRPGWVTNWGTYQCKVIHMHFLTHPQPGFPKCVRERFLARITGSEAGAGCAERGARKGLVGADESHIAIALARRHPDLVHGPTTTHDQGKVTTTTHSM